MLPDPRLLIYLLRFETLGDLSKRPCLYSNYPIDFNLVVRLQAFWMVKNGYLLWVQHLKLLPSIGSGNPARISPARKRESLLIFLTHKIVPQDQEGFTCLESLFCESVGIPECFSARDSMTPTPRSHKLCETPQSAVDVTFCRKPSSLISDLPSGAARAYAMAGG